MTHRAAWLTAGAAALALGVGSLNAADEAAREKARQVFQKHKDAVVWVSAVVKIELTLAGRTQTPPERKLQVLGTVIDPSGLVVVAFSAVDPGAAMQDRTVNVPGVGPAKMSVKTEHSEVKIQLYDGTEVPARIVLKDPDWDVAFVLPDKPEPKLSAQAVAMTRAPKLRVLDDLVCLGRMSNSLDQAPVMSVNEVAGIVTKPRTCILGSRAIGSPVFALDGTAVGVTVAFRTESDDGGTTASLVVLPAEDVMKVARQALEAAKNQPATAPDAGTQPVASQPTTAPAAPAP